MMTRGSSKRHTMTSPEDAANVASQSPNMASTSPSSSSSIRVRRTGLLTVTERPPVISPELVLEVEARMNRNYLPPSIQNTYSTGNNSPQSPGQGSFAQTQSSSSFCQSGSITAGTPFAQNQGSIVSGSLNQGFGQGLSSQGSIMSGTPNQGLSSQGSIMSGTPNQGSFGQGLSSQGSIMSGTPNQGSFGQGLSSQGSITSGTPNQGSFGQGLSSQGSIMSGTPNQYGQGSNQGSIMSGSPNQGSYQNQGSIVSGTPQGYLGSQNQGSITSGTPNQGSIMSGTPNQGSIMSGTPNQGSFTQNQSMSATNYGQSQNFSQNQGSITCGTPYNMNYQNTGFSQNQFNQNPGPMAGTTCNQKSRLETIPQGSIMVQGSQNQGSQNQVVAPYTPTISSSPSHVQTAPTFDYNYNQNQTNYIQNYGNQNYSNFSNTYQNVPSGSITAGTPLGTNFNPNYGSNQPATSFGSVQSANYGSGQSTNYASGQSGNYGTGQSSNYGSGQSANYGSGQSANYGSGQSANYGSGQSANYGSGQSANYGRQRKYSGPQRVKLATVQEMAREHAERYSPVRRAEVSPPRQAHDLASARLEYQQLQRGLERTRAPPGASPPLPDTRHPPASMPGSPIHSQPGTLELSSLSGEALRALLAARRALPDHADPGTLTQETASILGINLHSVLTNINPSQEILKALHITNYSLLSGHTSPASPGSPLHQITEGLSYLHTGSITRGTPQASATPLDLRNNIDMDTGQYQSLLPMVHPQIHIVTHRSLNNSPISNPGSPLDMIQEEIGNGEKDLRLNYNTHPQISVTDCLGSEVTLVASSSEDSMDSLENSKYHIPQFVISEPSDLDNRPSITKGIGRKVSQETEIEKDQAMQSPKEEVDCYLRRGSDKSLGFSDDSLSNDSANASPNCDQNVQSLYSNLVSISSGFSENRGSFSEHRESFSFSDRGSFSERGDFGRSSISDSLGRGSFSEKGETPRTSISAQGTLGEVKEYYEDVYMSRDDEEINKIQRSTMDLRLSDICRPDDKIPILLSPQKVSCVQEYYEVTLSTVCSKLDSQRIIELLKEAINTRVPPRNIFVETKCTESDNLTGFLNLEYSGGIQIELIVCENKAMEKKGLKMRRISGDQREYGKLCEQLITSLTA